ncbi:MarR family transcriptional regulator [Enemella evansiae]|uniref:MarR family transcriptional regulator n=1 Tax=Enemella evansiae TaxID=2016499 RepID=UPI000B96CCB6|nr:helix-turn-helix domain-containing protein [Enemella evansiae]OYN93022.1 MarR family transcriptional regulator [Enemella evansiae]OYO04145.1 MarR family transcriptional regulator [Enemella evansiae]
MNGVDLFLLGRVLMRVAEASLPTDGRTGDVRVGLIVASDIADNPGTSASGIVARTGLPQSRVSGAISRLKTAGAIDARPDPADGRRILINPAQTISERVAEVRTTSIATALSEAMGDADPGRVADAVAMLEQLGRALLPERDI